MEETDWVKGTRIEPIDPRKMPQVAFEMGKEVGYTQAREEMDIQLTSLADLCLEHRKGGIKTVVEWLESTCGELLEGYVYINKEIWQAKLEEWGI